ncbi:hypothetical protein AB0I84_30080 [Streptomyces spectabilis]|uniref:Uncharacterized protein n=1 Tax=Streptomyces spectabilis TaxID=68270 RepID=A0A7W8ESE4_STRST|nr:hypothetical protein [Streptomyces spectabilis]MBB5102013.1 hypothetical protein [Streptomyces spectabilis]MCI3907064.1 hypothetical protein [Streptomyces spectabilis]GGV35672.1 hypothetical protein GCM10010245_57210 [Streptomyces spectabilis]
MKRKIGTRHKDDTAERRSRRPSPAEIVKLVNGTAMGMGGAYVLTSSALIAVLAGVLAVVLAALYFL